MRRGMRVQWAWAGLLGWSLTCGGSPGDLGHHREFRPRLDLVRRLDLHPRLDR